MKTVLVRSMSLPKGVPVPHLENLAEAKQHVNGSEEKLVELLNKYGRQKDSLVNARDFLSDTLVDTYKFPRVDRKSGKPVDMDNLKKEDKPETETDHLDRFADAAVAGKVTATGLTVTGKDDKEKLASVWNFLQSIIDKHGPFPFDLNATKRVGGKPKKAPVWAIDAATGIINSGAKKVAEWVDKFTNGYQSKGYGKVEPIEFTPFDVKPAAGASAEDVEKTRQSNITALAWAIVAVEEQKRANTAKAEYV